MISYAQALATVRALGARRAVGAERAALADALGRVAGGDVRSPETHPAFDNSGVDGFAVRAVDLAGASPDRPVTLPVAGSLAAGDAPVPSGAGRAVEIMTGASLPAGCDAVVRVEDVAIRRDAAGAIAEVTFRRPVPRGRDVRRRGEDFRAGDAVLTGGTVLRGEHVMALAALGLAEVEVRRRPTVAIVATGKELVPAATRDLPPGAVRNSTSPYLATALPAFGAEVASLCETGDDPGALTTALEAARRAGVDVVLTTGAVSMGKHDFVAAVLAELGAEILFHKVAVRPGKPVLLAELRGGPAVLGLPGNPVASAVSLRFLGAPLLRAMLGLAPEPPLRARLRRDAAKPDGLRCFFKAEVAVEAGGPCVEVLTGQGSAILSSLVTANAWAILPEDGSVVAAGADVDVHPLSGLDGWPLRGTS